MSNTVVLQQGSRSRNWLFFESPLEVISISRLSEVLEALRYLQEQVEEKGLTAAGFISYEAAPAFDDALVVCPDSEFPLLWFGLFKKHRKGKLPAAAGLHHPAKNTIWHPSISKARYRNDLKSIRTHLARGNSYQVNYSYRLRSRFSENPWNFFLQLTQAQQGEFGAFIDTPRWSICSASPELFFSLKENSLESRPMKGTAPRGLLLEDDKAQAELLTSSDKTRAENIMIVDMIRNDMARVSTPGSVSVKELCTAERYPTLWQMTSTVCSETTAPVSEIIQALFPCASITGCPKPRTTEIIASLEQCPRRVYTGAIGFFAPQRQARFNVAIRTAIIDKKHQSAEYGTGGGIVWDSLIEEELEESSLKTKVLQPTPLDFSLLETILWDSKEGYFLLGGHLSRLEKSAEYFSIPVNIKDIEQGLKVLQESFSQPHQRIRLLVDKKGRIKIEIHSVTPPGRDTVLEAVFAKHPVDKTNPFLYHKTTHRLVYKEALREEPGVDDVILWNKQGEVTESCTANVVIRSRGKLLTPPVSCGLLPGVFREELLEKGKIREAVISKRELKEAEEIFLVNSVRCWRRVDLNTLNTGTFKKTERPCARRLNLG